MCLHVKVESYNWVNCLILHDNFQSCSIPDFEMSLLFWFLVYFGGLSRFERTSGMILENNILNFTNIWFRSIFEKIRSLVAIISNTYLQSKQVEWFLIEDCSNKIPWRESSTMISFEVGYYVECKRATYIRTIFGICYIHCQMISLFEIYQVWISISFILQY